MAEDWFQTYFPHVDNIYSHRSTQRYKRKPFVSHYWDCRLKGRPPGTPKSEDPNKKKRKLQARERNLCDVKIKTTDNNYFAPRQPGASMQNQQPSRGFGMLGTSEGCIPLDVGDDRYCIIERVNGNGGNGKGAGTAGPHKHTLQESDRKKYTAKRSIFCQLRCRVLLGS
ncbi:hypothetical protein MMC29_004470 [Sticta canariensis]|nr:hypothetical protein [Sticta canariensis]